MPRNSLTEPIQRTLSALLMATIGPDNKLVLQECGCPPLRLDQAACLNLYQLLHEHYDRGGADEPQQMLGGE